MIALAVAAALALAATLIAGGYVLWLLTAPRRGPVGDPAEWPAVLIVVPAFDEAPLIERKLANLDALDYAAAGRHVVVVDGGSADGTVQRAARWMRGRTGFDLLETTCGNKTAQINAALRAYPGPRWVLVTDADALLAPDVLRRLVGVAVGDPAIGVVGARVRPAAAHALEALHWKVIEWLRDREYRRAASAGIVAAPCYLADRRFIADLPSDAVADDVHVACRAMIAGCRVGHADASVVELRSPRHHGALLAHKLRKADAYMREVFRFLPHVRAIPSPVRLVFLWRAALLVVAPPLAVLACAAGIVGVTATAPPPLDAAAAAAVGGLAPLAARSGREAARIVWLGLVLAAVSAAALARYPFSRQAASFRKVLQPWEYQLPEDPR